MRISRSWRLAAVAVAVASTSISASAQTLLVSTGLGSYTTNQYGGSVWNTMTGVLNAAFPGAITTATTIDNSSYVLGFDRLWVDQRLFLTLSANEVAAISAFAATGKRMVLIGENSAWTAWNNQLASIVGGTTTGPDCLFNPLTPAIVHPLTAGVTQAQEACGYGMNGGTSVFAGRGVATLWGANQNVLVWLDSNMQDDLYGLGADNQQFAANVATWLAGGSRVVVPEPSSMVLLAAGLAALAVTARRRRA